MKLRLTKRQFRLQTPLKLPLLLLISGISGIAIPNFYAPPAIPSPILSANEQLNYMYEADQGDRLSLRFVRLNERDQERLQRVIMIHERGVLSSPENFYQAATILHHEQRVGILS